jgi:serralysin
MCRMCDQQNSALTSDWFGSGALAGIARAHYQRAADVGYVAGSDARYSISPDAFPADGVGDKLVTTTQTPSDLALTAAVLDDIPNDASTTASLVVGGPRVISTINTPGDEDWFRVELQAGVTYEFGQYGTRQGATGVKLPDAWVEIYDANGNRLAFADGGSPNDSIGLDALLTFTAPSTVTYDVNARAFDDVPLNGDTGDFVGDYEVFARVSRYTPYYDLNSPLHSLDWGTQFDGTSRNPDNAEGPRPTGNEVENKIGGKNVIYVYFAREGEVFVDNSADPLNLTTTIIARGVEQWEKNAFNYVFAEFEKVADIDYVETDNRWEADIVIITYNGTPGPGVSLLGRMSPPDTPSEGQTEYNAGDERWTQQGLAPGGFYFGTLIHEFGHGHGMAHPHDNGGRSSVMRDSDTESGHVEETTPLNYTLGDGDLNQGVYTMMSYMDGWQLSPYGQADSTDGYGFIGSLMALDIAVIQDKYGVNEEWATGDNTYTMMDVNQTAEFDAEGNITREATSYKSIWDAGGVDQIVYNGARNANIDLRAATLKYEQGGGGWISYAFGIYGGYTIANGVTIENATSGSGNDTLRGNSADNILDAGDGNDFITLSDGGVDSAIGGGGNDVFLFGAAMTSADKANGGLGNDQIALQGDYAGPKALTFGADVLAFESIALLPGSDTRFGDPGTGFYSYRVTTLDGNIASGVQVIVDASRLRVGEDVVFDGSAETDGSFFIYGGKGVDGLTGGGKNDIFLFGADGQWGPNDSIQGHGGIDQLALRGNYTIAFGAGQLSSIENIGLVSAHDTRFGALGTNYSYDLTLHDGNIAPGVQLTLDGTTLRAAETIIFNASAETDGSVRVFGGAGADVITGSQGNDILVGGGAADYLKGGAGADVYRYRNASESTSTNYDRIDGFEFGTDQLDLPGTHDSYGSQAVGVLNSATFDSNMAVAMTGVLGPDQAVFFAPTAGDQVGRLFLIVDLNGNAGYQAGEDLVIEFINSTPPPIASMPDFIV